MKIKICGLSRLCDIDYVNEARPDFCGFVFARSRRQISIQQAEKLRENLADEIIPVGVFVNEPVENIVWLLENGIVRWPQLHGAEDENYIAELRARTDGKFPIIRALKVSSEEDIRTAQTSAADFLLFDHGAGGTGETFNWNFLHSFCERKADEKEVRNEHLIKIQKPFFLAGGLNLQNLEEARQIPAFALDLSSGAETDGFKDREKVIELVRRIHND